MEVSDYSALYGVFDEILAIFDALVKTESEKIKYVAARDVAALDELIRREQAQILQLRGFEKKRAAAQAAAGLPAVSLAELIPGAPPDDALRLQRYHTDINKRADDLKELVADAARCIEFNLDALDSLITGMGGSTLAEREAAGKKEARPPQKDGVKNRKA